MYTLRIKQHFDAAHFLKNYEGECAKLHGHRWEVQIVMWYHELNDIGLAVDFKEVKSYLTQLLPDHKCLNDIYTFNPTAENLARHFYEELKVEYGTALLKVIVWETPYCSVEYGYNNN